MITHATRRDNMSRLTPRQSEVLGLVAQGRSNIAIARQLGVAEKTVVRHISLIYDQLDLYESNESHRRVLAAVTWLTARRGGEPLLATG